MIILYKQGTTKATADNLGEAILIDTPTCEVSEEINGKYELEMTYPVDGSHYKDITIDKYIKAKINPYEDKYQLFKIYSISKPLNGVITINAQHSSYDASYVIIHPNVKSGETEYEKINITTAVQEIESREVLINDQAKSLYTIDVTSLSDYEKTANITFDKITSLKNILYNSIISPYEIEVEWDDTNATLVKKRGVDRGVVLNYGKNIDDLEEQITKESSCDAIYPYYWKTTSETSSGVSYKYQELYINQSVPTYSYGWLYKQEKSGVLGKVTSLITSTLKSYIFRVSPEVDSVYKNNLYLWNTYEYVNVKEIDDWELASEGKNDDNDFLDDLLTKIPVVGFFKTFIPTKEKMKALKSVFSVYYNLFSIDDQYILPFDSALYTSGDHVSDYRYIKQDTLNSKYIIYAAYKDENDNWDKKDQNRTNIELYYDSRESYGYVDKTTTDPTTGQSVTVRLYNAVYIKINNERLYCGFQKYSNVKENNFVYLGPQEDISKLMKNGTFTPFFETSNDAWNKTDPFITNKYMVYIHTANDSNYANSIFIPRIADTVEEITKENFDAITTEQVTVDNIWPSKIYKVKKDTESDDSEYKGFKEVGNTYSFKIEDKAVYTYDVWTKIATTKGLDPAYPTTAGESKTKIQKALLSPTDYVYYAVDAYTEKGDIVSYNKSYWYYEDSEKSQKDVITLASDDSRIFIDSITVESNTQFYTYRTANTNGFKTYTEVEEVEKLPDVSEADATHLFAKSTKSGVPDYYIIENSKWLKLTIFNLKKNHIYYNNTNYYKFNTDLITNVVNSEPPLTPVDNTLYVVTDNSYDNSPFKGCIFLNKVSINNNKNYLIQPVDVTSIADEFDDDLFTTDELESTTDVLMQSAGKKLLDFLRQKYITAPENNPNKHTNETTISYMHIDEHSSLMDMINLHKILLGDTIHIRYSKLGISSDLRVKSITYDVINNKYTDIVMGELTDTLATSVVTNNDGVSVLANDTGYTNNKEVGKIIAKSIQAAYVSAETFEATNATIDNLIANMITTQQLTAIEADIESLKTDPLDGNPTAQGGASSSVDIVTNIERASFTSKTIDYDTGITVSWDSTNKIMSIIFNT